MMHAAFSDIQWHLNDCVIESNKIAVCWNCTRTHDGELTIEASGGMLMRMVVQGMMPRYQLVMLRMFNRITPMMMNKMPKPVVRSICSCQINTATSAVRAVPTPAHIA